MPNRITTDQIFDIDGLQKVIAELEKAQVEAAKLLKIQIDAAKQLKQTLAFSPTAAGGGGAAASSSKKAMDDAAKQVAEIERLTKKYNLTLNENGQKIIELRKKQSELTREIKLNSQASKEEITLGNIKNKTYNQLSAAYSLNRMKLANMTSEQKKNTAEGRNLVATTKAISDELKAQDAALGNNTRNVGNYNGAVGRLWQSLKGLAAMYISMYGAQRAVDAIFTNTRELDSLNMAYEKTIPNTEALAQANSFLADVSDRYGINILNLRKAYLRYNAAIGTTNLTTRQTQQIFESVSKASSVLGLSAAKTDRVFNALEQMISKGKVSSEELRQQLGDSLPGSLQIMAKALGVSTLKLDDMLKKGQVLAEDALPKFAAELERAYNIENVNRIDNLTSAQGRFQTALVELIDTLDAAGAFTAFFNILTAGIKIFTSFISLFSSYASQSKQLREEYLKQSNAVNNLERQLLPLLSRYDELKSRTELNVDEQAELRDIINEVAGQVPFAAKEMDNYGNVIGINTEKTKEFIEAQKTLRDAAKAAALEAVNSALEQNKSDLIFTGLAIKTAQALGQDTESLKVRRANLIVQKEELSQRKEQLSLTDFEIQKRRRMAENEARIAEIMREIERDKLGGETKSGGKKGGKSKAELEAEAAREAAQLRIDAMEDGIEKELALLDLSYQDKKALFEKHKIDIGILDEDYDRKRAAIEQKYEDEADKAMLAAIKKKRDADIAAEQERIDLMPDGIEKLQAKLDLEYSIKEKNVKDKLALDKWYETELAKIRQKGKDEDFASAMQGFKEQQALDKEEFESTKRTAKEKQQFEINAEIETIAKTIELKMRYGQELSDTELAALQFRMDNLKKELGKVDKLGAGGQPKNLYDMLGLNIPPDQQQALNTAFDFAKGQLNSFMAVRKQIADEKVSDANREVTETRRVLDAELDARNAGLANNVETAQREYELARANQRRALDEQRKAAKEQRQIEAIQQASSLVTATAKIWGQLSFPAALPAIAIMWGSFIAAQARAAQLSRRTYGKGMFERVRGGSHVSGDDVDFGVDHEGRERRVEGGEGIAVFPKKSMSKYGGLVERVVNDIRTGQFLNNWQQSSTALGKVPIFNYSDRTDTSVMESYLGRLVETANQGQYVNNKGQVVRRWGNHYTTYL